MFRCWFRGFTLDLNGLQGLWCVFRDAKVKRKSSQVFLFARGVEVLEEEDNRESQKFEVKDTHSSVCEREKGKIPSRQKFCYA